MKALTLIITFALSLLAAPLAAEAQQVQDPSRGTVGWFALGTGAVGITQGQTLTLSVVNVGAVDANVHCGIWQNPRPLSLCQDSFTLRPGQSKDCRCRASDLSREHFDKTGRAQLRAFVRSSARTVLGNLEVFDDQTGRTSIILPLEHLGRQE